MTVSRSLRSLLVLLLAVGVIVGGGLLTQREIPQAETAAEVVEPIGTSVVLCPEPGIGSDTGVRVTAAVVPGLPGQDTGAGRAALATLPGTPEVSRALTAPGQQVQITGFGRKLPPIEGLGIGALAPGFIADQWSRDPRGKGRGMASTACGPAASEFWFVGGGAIAGRKTRVVLVNPDDSAAVVDVIVHGVEGIIDAPAGRGLVVQPRSRLIVSLDVLVPGESSTALHVIARTGRVGATVDDDQMTGLRSVGTDWLPPAAMPATTVYVPGVLPGGGARVLSVVAPGENDATVRIRVLTADGAFAPADRDTMRVPAGTVASMDLSTVVEGQPATVEITSDVPVAAGMRQFITAKRKPQRDTTFSAGSEPFTGPAAVSGLPIRRATTVHVGITAPTDAAVVDITMLGYAGQGVRSEPTAPKRVRVGPEQVAWVELDPPAGAEWFTAVVTPAAGSGPVLVAHRVREVSAFGDLVTGYPWPPLRVTVRVPTAQEDLGLTVR